MSHCRTLDGYNIIFATAARSSNERIKALIDSGVDFIGKQAQFHKSCRREFFKEVEGTFSKNEKVSKEKVHSMTFEIVSDFIEKEIIGNRKAMLFTVILELYKFEFLRVGGKTEEIECYTGRALMKKIKDKFDDRISISIYDSRKRNFVYNSNMSEAEARASLCNDEEKHLHTIRSAALQLRSLIQALP